MSQRLIIENTGFGLRGALVLDGGLIDLLEADEAEEAVTDALHLGRVTAVDARLGAAFLDIGRAEPAFLNAKDARHGTGAAPEGSGSRRPIGELLKEGQRLIVQGLREAEGDKGSRVTTDLKLQGFHLLYRPLDAGCEPMLGTGRGSDRQALQERGAQLFEDRPFVLKKAARAVTDEVLLAEAAALEARWQAFRQLPAGKRKPGRLEPEPALERLLRAGLAFDLEVVQAADPLVALAAERLLAGPLAAHGIGLERLDADALAFEQTGVQEALEAAMAREVALPGGGRLIIEPTAACVAIDVDGQGRGALDTDMDAALAIGRLARLRNFGGTIVVDFIDLPVKAQRVRVEAAVKKAFRYDPLPVDVHPMTQLGTLQISRAKRGRSLDAKLLRACPACAGTGSIPSLQACAEAVLAAVRLSRAPVTAVRVAADLDRYLGGAAAPAWAAVARGVDRLVDPAQAPGGWQLGR